MRHCTGDSAAGKAATSPGASPTGPRTPRSRTPTRCRPSSPAAVRTAGTGSSAPPPPSPPSRPGRAAPSASARSRGRAPGTACRTAPPRGRAVREAPPPTVRHLPSAREAAGQVLPQPASALSSRRAPDETASKYVVGIRSRPQHPHQPEQPRDGVGGPAARRAAGVVASRSSPPTPSRGVRRGAQGRLRGVRRRRPQRERHDRLAHLALGLPTHRRRQPWSGLVSSGRPRASVRRR